MSSNPARATQRNYLEKQPPKNKRKEPRAYLYPYYPNREVDCASISINEIIFVTNTLSLGAAEVVPRSRGLTALQDLGLSVTPVPRNPVPSSGLHGYCIHAVQGWAGRTPISTSCKEL